jgi:hypothetical protein
MKTIISPLAHSIDEHNLAAQMNCPKCGKLMRKVCLQVTNNLKTGKYFKQYDKLIYECRIDDIWVTTEIPVIEKDKLKPSK